MGLQGALVDRARTIQRAKAGRKVQGQTIYGDVESQWFKCRVTVQSRTARTGGSAPAGGRPTVEVTTLMYALRDLDGEPVVVNADMKVEIDSVELGNETYVVSGDPVPIRKKRRLLGYTVSLQRVVEHEPRHVQVA